MKHNTPPADYITKRDLLDALREFGKGLHKELSAEIAASEKRLEIKMDIKFEEMERRIDDRARESNSKILTRFDKWAVTLRNVGIDQTLTSNRIVKLSDKVSNHEKRIKKLEKN